MKSPYVYSTTLCLLVVKNPLIWLYSLCCVLDIKRQQHLVSRKFTNFQCLVWLYILRSSLTDIGQNGGQYRVARCSLEMCIPSHTFSFNPQITIFYLQAQQDLVALCQIFLLATKDTPFFSTKNNWAIYSMPNTAFHLTSLLTRYMNYYSKKLSHGFEFGAGGDQIYKKNLRAHWSGIPLLKVSQHQNCIA